MLRTYLTELSLLVVAVIWALNFSVIKVTLLEMDAFAFNALRYMFAALLLISVTKLRGFSLLVKREHLLPIIGIGLVGNLVYQVLFIVGLDFTNAANAAVILGTIPVWVALLAHLFTDEKLTRIKLAGIICAFSGVVLIIFGRGESFSFASKTVLGDFIVLASAMAWASYTILSKKYLKLYHSAQYSGFMALVGVIALVGVGTPALLSTDFTAISTAVVGGILYSGLLSVGLAYLIWNRGVHKIGAVRTAAYQNLVPVLGVISGVVLLGEHLNAWQYLGSGSVLTGIYLSRY